MAQFDYDLHPVSRIIADAVGAPGNRTFYLQARQGAKMVSLIMEKQQVSALATSILHLLEELEEQDTNLTRARSEPNLHSLEMPLDPAFRVGQLGLGYDEEEDLVVIVAQSFVPQSAVEADEDLDEDFDDDLDEDLDDDPGMAMAGGSAWEQEEWNEDDLEDNDWEDDDWDEDEPESLDPEEEGALLARFYATRSQMRTLSEHALQVVQSGRPDCPLCGRPIDAEGHFCPRTDGHAFPLMV